MIKIPVACPVIDVDDIFSIMDVLKTGYISGISPAVSEFERVFSSWLGVKHAIACSSGTAALHLSLLALGIGPGDEVIVPDLTFASPINVIIHVGARPVLVDVTYDYWCIDPNIVEKCITERTKAIIVVHLYGHPADMDPIVEIAEKYGLYIIEDCAEAHGAEYRGRKVGTIGHIACFSFFANKIITTGEGGMVVTNDDEIAEKVRLYRDHGMKPRYWHVVPGLNYRMTGLQAALGISQMKKIDKLIEWKRRIAKIYEEELSNIEHIEQLHPEKPWARCVYWLYSIVLKSQEVRDRLVKKLEEHGIETRKFFNPIHIQPAYRDRAILKCRIVNSVMLSQKGLNLPSGPKISEDDVRYVAEIIRKVIREL